MKQGHVLYEIIILVFVAVAVMIGYIKLSGKPLVQRVDAKQAVTGQTVSDNTTPQDESVSAEPAEPPTETPQEQRGTVPIYPPGFLENEALTVFAYSSYHSALPAALLPPSSNYPQVNSGQAGASPRPSAEEDVLVHNGVFTGYLPAFPLTATEDLCFALQTPSTVTVRVCGAEESCVDSAIGQKEYTDTAFILFDPEKVPDTFFSAVADAYTSGGYTVTVSGIDTALITEDERYTLYGESLLIVTSGQLAKEAGCLTGE